MLVRSSACGQAAAFFHFAQPLPKNEHDSPTLAIQKGLGKQTTKEGAGQGQKHGAADFSITGERGDSAAKHRHFHWKRRGADSGLFH